MFWGARHIARANRVVKGLAVGLLWKRCGVNLAGRVNLIGAAPKIWCGGRMKIGNRVQFRNVRRGSALTCHSRAKLDIGDHCSINEGVEIDSWEQISIGDHTRIGPECIISDTSYHEVDEGGGKVTAGIEIGRNVWLARKVTVLPGVTIGDHCVVAAGAVVTQSFPEKTLIGGVPARKIRDIDASDDYVRT